MKKLMMALLVSAPLIVAERAHAQSGEDIAKAYVQAIVGGSGAKVAGPIDFGARNCGPSTVPESKRRSLGQLPRPLRGQTFSWSRL
jgi:hypothetical protein